MTIQANTLEAGANRVNFKSQGHQLAGNLYVPDGFSADGQYPAVLFSSPFNQVKEQTGAVYAEKLRALGYVVLVFDHLGFGDSEGDLRNLENPAVKMESIRDATSFLGTLPFVDRGKLFGLGVCASGGYMPLVATTDKRLKAIATVSGMMNNAAAYFGVMTQEQLMPLFQMANAARQQAYEGGELETYDALNMEAGKPADDAPRSIREGYDYYFTERAGTATYPNYAHRSPKTLMEYAPMTNAVAYAPFLYTPYLGIIGKTADTAPLTRMFFEACSEPKELFEVEGASHVSLYDVDADVSRAVEKMDAFFTAHAA